MLPAGTSKYQDKGRTGGRVGRTEEGRMKDNLVEPCKRKSGLPRAHFNTQEEAIAYASDPANTNYHEDVAVLCGHCGNFHLSHPSWLSMRPWETIATELK